MSGKSRPVHLASAHAAFATDGFSGKVDGEDGGFRPEADIAECAIRGSAARREPLLQGTTHFMAQSKVDLHALPTALLA